MEKYDGFIVCCAGPITEYELALNNLIARHGRRYIFVRTKVDIAIENEKKAHPSTFKENETLKPITPKLKPLIGLLLPLLPGLSAMS
jgi:hypothetical protein